MSLPESSYWTVLQRLQNVASACERPSQVSLLAVSKTRSEADIRALALLGQRAFGENYVQEGGLKVQALADLGLEWHLIGHLQSNKCREAATWFDWVQTIDRLKLVGLLDRFRSPQHSPLQVLVQVNVDGEASKSGCNPAEIDAIADAVVAAPRLCLRGLMAIPEPAPDISIRRAGFARMRTMFEALQRRHPGVDTLSMGMSEDFELAIAEGATMVRIGSALFGSRA